MAAIYKAEKWDSIFEEMEAGRQMGKLVIEIDNGNSPKL